MVAFYLLCFIILLLICLVGGLAFGWIGSLVDLYVNYFTGKNKEEKENE